VKGVCLQKKKKLKKLKNFVEIIIGHYFWVLTDWILGVKKRKKITKNKKIEVPFLLDSPSICKQIFESSMLAILGDLGRNRLSTVSSSEIKVFEKKIHRKNQIFISKISLKKNPQKINKK
jgi:hypothetical protein